DRALGQGRDPDPDLELVLEVERGVEVEGGGDPREADLLLQGGDGEAGRAPQGMLRLLHVTEEVAEVDETRHVRLVEVDAAAEPELAGQAVASPISSRSGLLWYSSRALNSGVRSLKTLPTRVSTIRECSSG